jgi:hypothetical protein
MAMATMLDYHNLLVMSVHLAIAVTILLDDDGIFSFRRRGEWHCNSESREWSYRRILVTSGVRRQRFEHLA